MPRTWGYIIIVAAIMVGAAALLLPVPETVEVAPVEKPKSEPPPVRAPTAASSPRTRTRTPPPPPAAEPAKPPVRPVPMQDTTKTRQLIQPKPAG
jgi:hypothetical protein